jgi:iron-sulfur cluster assembly protein
MLSVPITLTDAAKARIRALTAKGGDAQGVVLRIAKGKGCGGNEYRMEHLKGDAKGYDRVDAGEGAALFVPVTDSFLMFGMTIDYGRDELGNEKFLFSNPNETARCGCGESFSVDPAKQPH